MLNLPGANQPGVNRERQRRELANRRITQIDCDGHGNTYYPLSEDLLEEGGLAVGKQLGNRPIL